MHTPIHIWNFQHSYPVSQGLAEPQTEKGKGQDFISLALFLLRHCLGERKLNMVNPCSFSSSPLPAPNQLEQEAWRGLEDIVISRDEQAMICQGVGCEQTYGVTHPEWVKSQEPECSLSGCIAGGCLKNVLTGKENYGKHPCSGCRSNARGSFSTGAGNQSRGNRTLTLLAIIQTITILLAYYSTILCISTQIPLSSMGHTPR